MKTVSGTEIRALCTDIDGTLLDSRRELSDATIAAIESIKDFMPIILASSRMPAAMRHLQRQLGILAHPLICYNGGYVVRYDMDGNIDVISSTQIPLNICSEILRMACGTSV